MSFSTRHNLLLHETLYTPAITNSRNFDSLNVHFIGNWPFGPSWAVCCDTLRDITFLGMGGCVCILDVSTLPNVILLNDSIRTRGFVNNLFYDHTTQKLYISAVSGGFEIWDITDLRRPSRISKYDVPKIVSDIFVQGQYAYLACGNEGLKIVDISDPANPYEIGNFLTPDSALSVIVSGVYAYVGDGDTYYNGGGLSIVDISSPTNPQMIGYCETPNYPVDLAMVGSYLYIADGEPGVAKLRIIDVSVPNNPQEIGFFRPDTINWFTVCTGVYVKDTIAFVAYHNLGIFIVNVSNPTGPMKISNYDTPGQAMALCMIDSVVFVADDEYGLCLLDVRILSNPHEIGHYDGMYPPNNLFIKDTLIFVSHAEEGIVRILNISDPTKPTFVSQILTTYGADGIFIAGSYAYVADWDGLCIIDISDINNPRMVGFCDIPGYPSGVFIVDTLAYVASYFSGLYVVNIALPTNPSIVGACNVPYEANDVIVIGDYAYVANYSSGFYIINVMTPTNPYVVGFCSAYSTQIDISWPFAYTAGCETGVHIIDISNPANPYEIYTFPVHAIDIHISDNLLYVGDNRFGLHIINVINPYMPVEVGFYQLPNLFPGCVYSTENLICIGTLAGLQIFEYIGTAIDEPQRNNKIGDRLDIRIKQNPVHSNTIELLCPSSMLVLIDVSIFNCVGRQLVVYKNLTFRHNEFIRIPIKHLTTGVYFVEIKSGLFKKMLKFAVIR
ncbi:MAG: hypothetical protein ABIL44_02070 [candidate division WOR-3 bacterium]